MAYSVLHEIIKDQNTPWFHDVDRAKVEEINKWTAQQPGFLSAKVTFTSNVKLVKVYTFSTQENYTNFTSLLEKNPNQIARSTYNNANNITTTKTPV